MRRCLHCDTMPAMDMGGCFEQVCRGCNGLLGASAAEIKTSTKADKNFTVTKNFTALSVLTVIFGGIRLACLSLLFCKSCFLCASKLIYRFQIFGRDEKLEFPSETPYHQELISPNGTLTFGEYSERLVNKYYRATP